MLCCVCRHANSPCYLQRFGSRGIDCQCCGACVQARSKPVQPPKKPASAPFFLPTVAGLHSEPLFDPSSTAADEAKTQDPSHNPSSSSRINKSGGERLTLNSPQVCQPMFGVY